MDLSAISQKILSTLNTISFAFHYRRKNSSCKEWFVFCSLTERNDRTFHTLHPWYITLVFLGEKTPKKTRFLRFFWVCKFKLNVVDGSKPQVLLPPWSGIFYDEVSRVIWSLHCMRRVHRRACSWGPYFWDFPVKPGRQQRAPQGHRFKTLRFFSIAVSLIRP